MKKIMYLLIVMLCFSLISCFEFEDEDNVIIEASDNIVVSYDEIENFNWRPYLDILINGKKIAYSLDNIEVKIIDGDPYFDDYCKFQVCFIYNGIKYFEEFDVKIDHKLISISNALEKPLYENLRIRGEVVAVNSSGFILADANYYIYVELNHELKFQAKVNQLLEIIGTKSPSGLIANYIIEEEFESNVNLKYISIDEGLNNFISIAINGVLNPTAVNISGILTQENSEYYLMIDEKKLSLYEVSNVVELFVDKEISIDGFLYETNDNQIRLVPRKIYQGEEKLELLTAQTNYAPILKVECDYLHFDNIPSFEQLLDAFEVYDIEDGNIIVTQAMMDGNFDNFSNQIGFNISDSDGNNVAFTLTVEVGGYKPNNMINYQDISIIDPNGMPSKGDVNVLVIPVAIGSNKATSSMLDVIKDAFFGTSEETGWESLKSYYQKSSNGQLNISGTVTPWYYAEESQSYYAKYSDNDDYIYGSTIIMEEALTFFKNTYDYSDFDSNNDGYIDAVYLVYNVGIGGNGSFSQENFYWAYTAWDTNVINRNYADTLGYSYVFLSYDFFNDPFEYANIDPLINTQTLIHETGHLMNLDDLYDYDDYDSFGNDGGYCAVDMMDWNIGDHGPYTKMLLGWVKPIEITKSGIYEIPAFITSNTCFVIGTDKHFNSVFSEYYLIDYYTFAGLNSIDIPEFLETKDKYAGIRISLVNATLTEEDEFLPYFINNNSDSKYKQIQMLEADYDGKFDLSQSNTEGAKMSDFYRSGDVFGIGSYKNFTSSDGNNIPFTLQVLSCDEESAIVKIIFK